MKGLFMLRVASSYGASLAGTARRARLVSSAALCMLVPCVAGALAQGHGDMPEVTPVNATISFSGDRKMHVSFEFLDSTSQATYTTVNFTGNPQLGDSPQDAPHLFGRLVPPGAALNPNVQRILIGISGGKSTVAKIDVQAAAQPQDVRGAVSFKIEFPRYAQLDSKVLGNLAVPGIAYGEVRQVTINEPSWASGIHVKVPEKTQELLDGVVIDLAGSGLVSFEIVPQAGGWARYVTTMIMENLMWFLGPLFFGSMLAFLAPNRTHRNIRIVLGLVAIITAAWVLRELVPLPPLAVFASSVAPVLAAEVGLLLAVTFFEKLDELLQRFGAR